MSKCQRGRWRRLGRCCFVQQSAFRCGPLPATGARAAISSAASHRAGLPARDRARRTKLSREKRREHGCTRRWPPDGPLIAVASPRSRIRVHARDGFCAGRGPEGRETNIFVYFVLAPRHDRRPPCCVERRGVVPLVVAARAPRVRPAPRRSRPPRAEPLVFQERPSRRRRTLAPDPHRHHPTRAEVRVVWVLRAGACRVTKLEATSQE